MDQDITIFAERLKALRAARGLQQSDISDALKMRASNVSNWERGISYPTLKAFRDLCLAIGCSADELLGIEQDAEAFDADEIRCRALYRNLGPKRREAVKNLIESLSELRTIPATPE